MIILANDGISAQGQARLEDAGFTVHTTQVAQGQLINYIQEHQVVALLVRSATEVRKTLIDACPTLKIIGRGGVGMDNIDVAYAKQKGLQVINTPAASSISVAELVFAHLFGGVRFLHDSNRNMPLDGDTRFKLLKKNYAGGCELCVKTIGFIGYGSGSKSKVFEGTVQPNWASKLKDIKLFELIQCRATIIFIYFTEFMRLFRHFYFRDFMLNCDFILFQINYFRTYL